MRTGNPHVYYNFDINLIVCNTMIIKWRDKTNFWKFMEVTGEQGTVHFYEKSNEDVMVIKAIEYMENYSYDNKLECKSDRVRAKYGKSRWNNSVAGLMCGEDYIIEVDRDVVKNRWSGLNKLLAIIFLVLGIVFLLLGGFLTSILQILGLDWILFLWPF